MPNPVPKYIPEYGVSLRVLLDAISWWLFLNVLMLKT